MKPRPSRHAALTKSQPIKFQTDPLPVGPQLNGLFGRHSGAVEGYSYSSANKNSGITWDEAVFADYIKDPRAKIPGTKMVFAGIKNEKEVQDLTAFLKQFGADGKKGP